MNLLSLTDAERAKIIRARKRLGLTQQQAADVAELTQPYWAAIESGSRQPTWFMLSRMCEAVGLELRRAIVSKRI